MDPRLPAGASPGGDLRSSFLRSRIAQLPHLPALAAQQRADDPAENDVEQDESASGVGELPSLAASTSMPPPQPPSASGSSGETRPVAAPRRRIRALDFGPLSADGFFEQALEVEAPTPEAPQGSDRKSTFRVYYTPPRPKRSARELTDSELPSSGSKRGALASTRLGGAGDAELDGIEPPQVHEESSVDTMATPQPDDGARHRATDDDPGTIFVLHHGAGFSALSFALVAKHITELTDGEVGVLALDARGHGRTVVPSVPMPDGSMAVDMSLSSLASDLVSVLRAMFPDEARMPTIIFAGHSMGGSVVVSAAHLLQGPGSTNSTEPNLALAGTTKADDEANKSRTGQLVRPASRVVQGASAGDGGPALTAAQLIKPTSSAGPRPPGDGPARTAAQLIKPTSSAGPPPPGDGPALTAAQLIKPTSAAGPRPPPSATSPSASRQRARVAGVAVLDVVEGTAMSALPVMRGIVESQPRGFDSVEDAVRWHVESGTIQNLQSARVSVPSLVVERVGAGAEVADGEPAKPQAEPMEELRDATGGSDQERDERAQGVRSHRFEWKAQLLATQPFWPGWFEGLSRRFLECRCARLLLLAGTDRLDKELTIGQMQGKYQLVVFPEVGHQLQEDAPLRTAQTLVDFWRRNEALSVGLAAKLPVQSFRKVGE